MGNTGTGDLKIPSDNLASLRKLIAAMGIVGVVHQVRVVVDSNWVLRDLRWLLGSRSNPAARTAFQEVLASGTLVAYAPNALMTEVQEHIPDLARALGIEENRVWECWESYQTDLHFSKPDMARASQWSSLRDPSDLPFVYLYGNVGAEAILTADNDIRDSTAKVVNLDVVLSLRDYSRAAAPEMTIKLGGALVLVAGIETLHVAIGTLKAIYGGITNLPRGAQVILLIVGILAAAHPKARNLLMDGLRSISARAMESASLLAPALIRLASDLAEFQERAQRSWAATGLSTERRYPARLVAYAVCLAASQPLGADEIERRMRVAGYKSVAREFRSYLVRVIRDDPRFEEIHPGLWRVTR